MLGGLAKELRDAGFPNIHHVQHRQGRDFLHPDGRVSVYSLGQIAPTEDWFIPTLEELIGACKYDHFSLNKEKGADWIATAGYENENRAYGQTPSEAVARLWLALKSSVTGPHGDEKR